MVWTIVNLPRTLSFIKLYEFYNLRLKYSTGMLTYVVQRFSGRHMEETFVWVGDAMNHRNIMFVWSKARLLLPQRGNFYNFSWRNVFQWYNSQTKWEFARLHVHASPTPPSNEFHRKCQLQDGFCERRREREPQFQCTSKEFQHWSPPLSQCAKPEL